MFTLLKLPKVTKRWGGKTKTHFGLLLTALSSFIYIEKIIEYMVPNVSLKSKFIIIVGVCWLSLEHNFVHSIYYAIQ